MDKNEMPYSIRMTLAMLAHSDEMVSKVVVDAFKEMTHKLMAVVGSYDPSDLPFVVADMLIVGNALKSILTPDGQGIVDQLTSHTATYAIDLGELHRQMEQEGRGE